MADAAGQLGEKFGADEVCRALGLVHDVGKSNPAFQRYLADCAAGTPSKSEPHSAPGAAACQTELKAFALAVLGHHTGLANPEKARDDIAQAEAEAVGHARAYARLVGVQSLDAACLPPISEPLRCEMFLRMCFSALIDADRLDTEAHFTPDKTSVRGGYVEISQLAQQLMARLAKLPAEAGHQNSAVNQARAEILSHCIERADDERGAFRLSAPTGGGKTLSSLAFALNHAKRHGMDRVIAAIPYTSIIDQTADVYGEVFGSHNLLEHHSAFETDDGSESQNDKELKRRLAAENWDCSLIVTTTVQLFDSLFSNRTSRCRKLHNITKSVILLDEVQTLPVELLLPILDALDQLIQHYGCSVVFCTATQPDFTGLGSTLLSEAREIVPAPERMFASLRRVQYERIEEPVSVEQVAERIDVERQALCVLNSRPDAVRVVRACRQGDDLFHLSTLMCPDHRKRNLKKVRERLHNKESVRLISTQVVEAGVDVDFPFVMRDIGPLDRIIQVAGRCNREGSLPGLGRCIVFELVDGRSPQGDYGTATAVTQTIIAERQDDFDALDAVQRYFRERYNYSGAQGGKGKEIQGLRRRLSYQDVADKFKLIPDDTVQMVVMSYDRKRGEAILASAKWVSPRALFRQLMPLSVSVPVYQFHRFQKDGLVCEHESGAWLYEGKYDELAGIGTGEERDPADLII